jgi:alkyl hydroperoxide reductase subunit AhpF
MLDSNILEQLNSVFAKLEKNVVLAYKKSEHADQKNLIEMLSQISSTCTKIQAIEVSDSKCTIS